MTLIIEDHPNYGKDLLTIQREASFPVKAKFRMRKAAFRMLNGIRRELGLCGLVFLLRKSNRQTNEALENFEFY
ncbi:MAG: hypothetical protein ACFFCZ_25760 [Promethearchaeota archaeon]